MRLITDILRDIRKGKAVDEATEAFAVLDVAVRTERPAMFGRI